MNDRLLTKSEAQVVISHLQKLGRLTKEDIEEALLSNPPKHIKRITDSLHTLFCTEDCSCKYAKEEIRPDCWSMNEHKKWLAYANTILSYVGTSDETAFYRCLGTARGYYDEVRKLDDAPLRLFAMLYSSDKLLQKKLQPKPWLESEIIPE